MGNEIKDEGLEITVVGGAKQVKEEFEEIVGHASGAQGMESLYDRFLRLIYVIDDSGSMAQGLAPDEEVSQFVWEPGELKKFRKMLLEQIKEAEEEEEEGLAPEDVDFPAKTCSDEELKQWVLDSGVWIQAGIQLKRKPGWMMRTQTKIEAVKEAATSFVNARFDKYPDADVTLIRFGGEPHVSSRGQTRESVLDAIRRLNADEGDTQIVTAVDRALEDCKKRPGALGAHHIVLVTDGYDNGGRLMTTLLPKMKEVGVVLDFIFVKGSGDSYGYEGASEKIEAIKRVCQETGGEYTEVNTVKDFKEKFLAASSRLCLPPKR